ncbi:hypothetical protein NDI37_04835 [Funiculus sociatus GB2-A5]|uniref:Photosystem II subunit H n=1 Tax=Funiculus sociatus GB2-A5 TaxID=2933946 RepID=A0ABV0JK31_9CYAN|nr:MULTISPECIES: hypothetical protein [unclassified Trichocoleus]MBD1906792.1 hypothetical protein [Trichocoleus sp. FACHB-832]MBD2060847.1 hypothetical protein [Trichocoleus sp. FACHB-6]
MLLEKTEKGKRSLSTNSAGTKPKPSSSLYIGGNLKLRPYSTLINPTGG